jgi:hypothetical protein
MTPRQSETGDRAARWLVAGIVLCLAAVAVFNHLAFALDADRAWGHDALMHVTSALRVHKIGPDWEKLLDWVARSPAQDFHHAPLVPLLAGAVMDVAGVSPLAAMYAAKALWLLLLVGALYGAGRHLGGSPWAGLAAAILGGLSAAPLRAAREVGLEFPTAAAVALGAWGLAASRDFARRGGSALLGVLVGLGLLVKPTPALFIGPLLVAAYLCRADRFAGRASDRRRNALWALFLAVAVAGTYYLPLAPRILNAGYLRFTFGPRELGRTLATIGDQFALFLVSPLQVALVLITLTAGAFRRDAVLVPLVVAAAAGLAFTLAISDFSVTYLYPYLVIAALVVARGLGYLGPRARAAAALALAAVYAWPLALPTAAERVNVAYPSPWLFAVYPYADRGDQPLLLTAAPDYRTASVPWAAIETLGTLFADRYAEATYRDVGVLDPLGGETVRAAFLHGRRAADLPSRSELMTIPVLGGGDDVGAFRALARRRIVVALIPEPDDLPRADSRSAILTELAATHRRDVATHIPWDAPRRPDRSLRVQCFVRRENAPRP